MKEFVANTYGRFPVTFVKGEGCRLYDDKGREYLDFTSGIAVCNLGHCHPSVVEAVSAQAARLIHTSNLFWTVPQQELAQEICRHSFAERVFFCNSGAEAVEAAIKLARRRGHFLLGGSYEIVCLQGAFHGRTLAALSATGQPVYKRGFEPLPAGFTHVRPNDLEALEMAVTSRTCAILLEPIMGEGGVIPLEDRFLELARELCDRRNLLLMFDEVQVGMGRTGSLFAYQQTPVTPDVMCLAKGLGGGIPIGALAASAEVMEFLPPGTHASTFGGNPVACEAGKAVFRALMEGGVLDNAKAAGAHLRQGLERLAAGHSAEIREVRGRGLIQALELKRPAPGLGGLLLEQGLLVVFGHDRIIRLLPPLTVTAAEIDQALSILDTTLKSIKK